MGSISGPRRSDGTTKKGRRYGAGKKKKQPKSKTPTKKKPRKRLKPGPPSR